MFELILLSRFRTEVRLRGDERSRFEPQRAARFVPWTMLAAPEPAHESGEVSMLPRDPLLHADA